MESPSANELNVAYVCTGIAFELVYKDLVQVSGKIPISSHRIRDVHEQLERDTRRKVERVILAHCWKNIDEFLNYFDDTLRHEARRYWMIPKKRETPEFVSKHHLSLGYNGIDNLARLHHELAVIHETTLTAISDGGPEGETMT